MLKEPLWCEYTLHVLFFTELHNNDHLHTTKAMFEFLAAKNKVLPHLSYGPDLAPGDFWLFPKLKEQLRSRTFSINEDILLACNQIFARILATEFAKTFQKWIEWWEWCFEVSRYFEKKKFCEEQYMYIHTKGVLSTCFHNLFLSTNRLL